ncbi:CHRD domain-containing protein [Spirosoma rhododendri]|uniref:CHRD domain-containing protein n=1 Tax=Spirosoma rhododendri TaxID=2728024 RepID=A0A7L5DJL9_9BACT|nr:CHRD domain-containing protein [Spirosoma rhododendri]QJD78644.1 CHRD domain-containing protein [Spirosoma rhododendri]
MMTKPKMLATALMLVAAPLLMTSCSMTGSSSTPDDPNDTFGASLSGSNEVPPVSTSATGNYTANYNRVTKVLSYTVTYQGLTPTMGHIHSVTATSAAGNNGPVSIGFGSLTSPIVGQATLTQDQQDAMYGKRTYANLHTTANPNGEIRGNIVQTD